MASLLENHGKVAIIEQDKVRAMCCMCINKQEKQYNVLDDEGRTILVVVEDKDNCCRTCWCCFSSDYDLKVKEESESEKKLGEFYVHRRYCHWFQCLQCCRYTMTAKDENDNEYGTVGTDYKWPCDCTPQFSIKDMSGNHKFEIEEEDHWCAYFLCCGAESRYCCGIKCYIQNSLAIKGEGFEKTKIEHMDGGRSEDADAYHLDFPEGVTGQDKLLMIAGVVCVDYTLFSASPPEKEDMNK